MPSQQVLSLVKGTSHDFPLQALDALDQPATGYVAGDPLSCRVWPGGAYATVLTPTIAWIDAPTARFQVSFDDADTADTDIGRYRIQALVDVGGRSDTILDCFFELTDAPGDLELPPVYGSYSDLILYCDWIDELQSDRDLAGFVRQRGRARSWLDNALVRRWKITNYAPPQIGDPGFGSYSWTFGATDPSPSVYLRQQLALDKLIVTDEVIEMVSKRALALILDEQMTREGKNPYRELARKFFRESSSRLKCLRAEVDINDDGYADMIVNMGASNVR